ncbi:MAG: IS1595 family transposase [Chloroflexota bacterium]
MGKRLSVTKIIDRVPDEASAYAFMEELRWPNGPVCAHCGHDKAYFLTPKTGTGTRKTRTGSASARRVWKCAKCREQFSVMVGTVFEDSHIPLNKWLAAFYMMCSGKKGVSAKQIELSLGITYKSAWFLSHRIREAMAQEPLKGKLSGIVEVDETYIGGKGSHTSGRGAEKKVPCAPQKFDLA